jgi:CheY-like chemotaxis protein
MCVRGDGHVIAGYRGGEVLGGVRGEPATAGIPVAILSAEVSPAIIHRMRTRGFITYLTKPLDSFMAGHDHGAGLALRTVPAR